MARDDDYADDGAHDGSVPTTASSSEQQQVPGGRTYTVDDYVDAHGALLVELVAIDGAGHAWPGGPDGASFSDPTGPDATGMSYAFFAAHPR